MPELLNMAQVADREGVTREAVRKQVDKLVAAGLLVVQERGHERLIDPAEFRAAKEMAADPARILDEPLDDDDDDASIPVDQLPGARTATSYNKARAEEQEYRTARAKLRFERESGLLTNAVEAEAEFETIFRTAHERVRRVISTNAEEAMTIPDRRAFVAFLADKIDAAFDDLARGFQAQADPDDSDDSDQAEAA